MKNDQDLRDKADELLFHLRQIDPIRFEDRKTARELILALVNFREAEGDLE